MCPYKFMDREIYIDTFLINIIMARKETTLSEKEKNNIVNNITNNIYIINNYINQEKVISNTKSNKLYHKIKTSKSSSKIIKTLFIVIGIIASGLLFYISSNIMFGIALSFLLMDMLVIPCALIYTWIYDIFND